MPNIMILVKKVFTYPKRQIIGRAKQTVSKETYVYL